MVAAVVVGLGRALRVWRAAELAAPDHQRVVEHAALLQIEDQARRRPGRCRAPATGSFCVQAAVMVPAAMVELDEAHVALGQPPRQQAVRREGPRLPGVLAVERHTRAPAPSTCPPDPERWPACGTPSRTARCGFRFPDRRRGAASARSMPRARPTGSRRCSRVSPGGLER